MNISCIFIYIEEYEKCSDILSVKQKAELLDALVAYGKTGELYTGKSKIVLMAFRFIVSSIQRTNEKYQQKCAANKNNANKRWKNKDNSDASGHSNNSSANKHESTVDTDANESENMSTDANECESMRTDANECEHEETKTITKTETITKESIKKKRGIFSPPTVEDVTAYCCERKNNIDPKYFVDYYTARDWKFANGRQMTCWKSAIVTWEKNERRNDHAGHTGSCCNADGKVRSQYAFLDEQSTV